jgi:hypothetical protein
MTYLLLGLGVVQLDECSLLTPGTATADLTSCPAQFQPGPQYNDTLSTPDLTMPAGSAVCTYSFQAFTQNFPVSFHRCMILPTANHIRHLKHH